jgi:MFS transporter, DHA1 family, multidrug resistance protein
MVVVSNVARRLRWDLGLGREVGLAFWAMTFLEAAFGSYMGVWPLWIEHLGAPVALVGLVLGASGILRLFVLIPSASLSERLGVRRLVIAARTAALVGLVGAALSTHWSQLAIMVIGSAIGELAFPLIKAHVAHHAGTNRIRAFTLTFTVGPSVALFVTPLLSGALIELTSMRAAFVLAATCTALSILFFWKLSPGQPRSATRQVATGRYQDALADRAVRRLLVFQGATVFSLALGTSLVPTFLEDVRGLSPATIASLGALAAIGSTLFGLAVVRFGRLQRSPFTGAAFAVALTAIGFGLFLSTDAILLVAFAFVFRGGLFSAWALFNAGIAESATETNRSRSFALSEMIAGLGISLAPMVAGPLFALNAYAPLSLALTVALLLIPILILTQSLARARPAETVATSSGFESGLAKGPVDAPAS